MCVKDGSLAGSGLKMLVRVETNGDWRTTHIEDLTGVLQGMQVVCGGEHDDGLVAYCDEDGNEKGLLPNNKVRNDMHLFFKSLEKHHIVGAVLIGRRDENGDECGLLGSDLMEMDKYFGNCSCKKVQHTNYTRPETVCMSQSTNKKVDVRDSSKPQKKKTKPVLLYVTNNSLYVTNSCL
jgi:hypothetical protein